MKLALIDPFIIVDTGLRVAQVEPEGKDFPVSEPYYWVSCPDDTIADKYFYDPKDKSFAIKSTWVEPVV